MKSSGLLIAAILGLSGQTPMTSATVMHHYVYQFGYNTKVASSGNGTGTTTVEIRGPAKDGGVMVSGTDYWWNTARPRATNTCELYPNGGVSCLQRPYAISPIQLTLFPLLGRSYFKALSANGTSSWARTYQMKAAILPGQSGFAGNLTSWNCAYSLHGQGPIANAGGLLLIVSSGTLAQQGGRYFKATSKQRVVYDPVAKLPVIVRDTRTRVPQLSVNDNYVVELKLTKKS